MKVGFGKREENNETLMVAVEGRCKKVYQIFTPNGKKLRSYGGMLYGGAMI